jgi:penicillin-binding protein 1A
MRRVFIVFITIIAIACLGSYGFLLHIKSGLPNLSKVEDYRPLLVSQVFDKNGKKMGEFFKERRSLIPYNKIPKIVIQAFLAAEDDRFFEHSGINLMAISRAFIANMRAGRSVQGGSTITQQVAKTLLLSDEKTLMRKASEALLAIQMEEHLTKEEILYLYLNQIYFGQGAYGISMAAETYFRKPVEKLTLAECAILAGLPKAPSAFSPVTNPKRAKERQTYVLRRMSEVGYIQSQEAEKVIQETVKVYVREKFDDRAPHFLETIRLLLVSKLGETAVLESGIQVHTTLDTEAQIQAQRSVLNGLRELDKRTGFRGPIKNLSTPEEIASFREQSRKSLLASSTDERIIEPSGAFRDNGIYNSQYDFKTMGLPSYIKTDEPVEAVVVDVRDDLGLVVVGVAEVNALIDFDTMKWARKPNPEKRFDQDQIKKPSAALKKGDVVLVQILDGKFISTTLIDRLKKIKTPVDLKAYATAELDQEPGSEGALLSLDNNSEEVLAMVGGKSFAKSQYNRAIQAARQTGSLFKAIVYTSALDHGYTASTPLMDAPLVYEEEDSEGQETDKTWRPANHSKKFSGDIILRNALVKSLNIPSVKIIEDIGVDWAVKYSQRLGVFSPLNKDFTLVLGSSSVTLYEMTKVFSQFARLGKKISPRVINKVNDASGKILVENLSVDERFQTEINEISNMIEEQKLLFEKRQQELSNSDAEEKNKKYTFDFFYSDPNQLIAPTTAYLITSILKGVVDDPQGTGGRARALGREVAGKTGSTNGYKDAWFVGYTPQITTGVWVGYDHEQSLGKGEVGGRSALPIWIEYSKYIHQNIPPTSFTVPEGIVFVNIDGDSGNLAGPQTGRIVRQAFKEGTEPTSTRNKDDENVDFIKGDASGL